MLGVGWNGMLGLGLGCCCYVEGEESCRGEPTPQPTRCLLTHQITQHTDQNMNRVYGDKKTLFLLGLLTCLAFLSIDAWTQRRVLALLYQTLVRTIMYLHAHA